MFLCRYSVIVLLFILTGFSLTAHAVDYMTEAKQYMQKGEYPSAIIQLKNQLKNNPQDADARFLLGTLYLQQAKIKGAIKELGKANEFKPGNIDYKLAYSKALLLNLDYQQANHILNFSTTGENENLRQVYQGYANLGLKQVTEAKENFQFAVNNEFIEGYTGLAKIAFIEKDFKLAEQNINQVLSRQADDPEALLLQAKIFNSTQRLQQAVGVYNHLIEKNSNNKNYYLLRASTFLVLKEYEQATSDVDKILKTNKDHAYANYLLAQIKLHQKDYRTARDAALIVLKQSSHHYQSKLILGISNYALGNLNQADKYITEYLSNHPENLAVQDLLANVYLAQKKPQQAVIILEGLEQEKIDLYPNINTTLGSAYLLMGEHQKGIEFLNKAKELDPDNLLLQKRLITGQFRAGDRESAISGLERVARLDPDNKKVQYLLMISYIQDKKLDSAEKKLDEMLKKSSNDPMLYNFLAVIETLKGNKDKAKQAYHKVLTVDKNFIPAYMGLAKFAYSEGNEKEAVSYFKQVTEINKQYLASYLALASIAEKNNNNKQAEQYLLSALKHNKGNLQVQLKILSLLGKWYAKFKQPEKVLVLADDLIKQYPEDLSALSFLASAQMINGKNKAAEKTLKDIVRRDSKDSKHRILLANLIAKQPNSQSDVLILLDEVYNNDTTKPVGLVLQVKYLIKWQQYQQAEEISKKITALFPDIATGIVLQGDVFLVQGQKDKAYTLYRQAYQKQSSSKLLSALIKLMIKDNKSDIAVNLLNDELADIPRDQPRYKDVLFILASTYLKLEQQDQAIKYYQELLLIQEDHVQALNNLAWIYYTQKNPEAIKLAEKAYLKASGSADIADTYAVILLEQPEQADKALKILQPVAKKAANNYDIQFHLAKAYVLSGNDAEAEKILNFITTSEKEFSEKQAAVELLKKLTD